MIARKLHISESRGDGMFRGRNNNQFFVRLKNEVRFFFSLPLSCLRVYGLRFLTSCPTTSFRLAFGMTGGYIGKGKVKRCGCTAPFHLPPSLKKRCHSEWSLSGMRNLIDSLFNESIIIKHITHLTNSPFNHSTNSPFNHLTNSPFHQPTPLTYAGIL